jgi:flagellar hook-associated protein 1 FlgK
MGGSLFGMLGIAESGLSAQSAALDATGQNVANVNTPGYSRVTANLETTDTLDTFSGGVTVAGVSRSFDSLTFASLLTQQGLGSAADARSSALAQTETTIAPSTGTIGDNIDSFFASVQTLETSPSDPSARVGVLSAAGQLATSVAEAAGELTQQRSSLLTEAQGVASTLNQSLAEIASLNSQIASVRGSGAEPTDLEDQRDELASTVSQAIGGQVVTDSNGDWTLLSSGTALVTNGSAATVAVGLDGNNNLQVTSSLGGASPIDITHDVTSGTLGGIREARDTDIVSASSQLDQLAFNLSNSVNAVQSAGYGLDGVAGRNLFTAPATVKGAAAAMALDPTVANDPDAVAASTTAATTRWRSWPSRHSLLDRVILLATRSVRSARASATWRRRRTLSRAFVRRP